MLCNIFPGILFTKVFYSPRFINSVLISKLINQIYIKKKEEKKLKQKYLRIIIRGFYIIWNNRSADGTVYKHFERGDRSKEVVIDYPTQNIIHIPGKYHEHYRQTVSHNEIPANIKAKFGSRNTRELLKDELKVHDTLSKIYNTGIIWIKE